MLAAASWAARLKAGLARTREVLNTDIGELLTRRKIDEALFEELESALLVNPYDLDGVADAIAVALAMPQEERRERWQAMMSLLQANDIRAWRHRYLAALRDG